MGQVEKNKAHISHQVADELRPSLRAWLTGALGEAPSLP